MFETDLTIDECLSKLKGEFKTLRNNYQENCYIGKTKDRKFSFYYHFANRHTNNIITCNGKLIDNGSKTAVKVRYNSMYMSFSYFIIAFILLFLLLLFGYKGLSILDFAIALIKYYSLMLLLFSLLEIITIHLPKNKEKIKKMNLFLYDLLGLQRKIN